LVINERVQRKKGIDRERKGARNAERKRLTSSAPLLLVAIKEVRTQRGGEENMRATSSAARQTNHYIT